jgi:hypothetical protein
MPTRTASSIEAWHLRAAILRCHSYLLSLQDTIDCGVSTVDMDAQFHLWLASEKVDECGRMALIPAAATPGTGSSSEVCQLLVGGGPDPTAAVRESPSPSPIKHFEISERAYEGVLRWAKACPISRDVERIVNKNGGGPCSRHALYGWARQAASSASMERRANVVRKVMEYIASRLTASILSEHEDYRIELVSWIKNPFLSECSTLLPEKELEPLNDASASHGLIPRPSRALSRRLTAAPRLSPFARFRDLDDRCHVCFDPKPELVCGCGRRRGAARRHGANDASVCIVETASVSARGI